MYFQVKNILKINYRYFGILKIISFTQKTKTKDKQIHNRKLLKIVMRNVNRTYNGDG